MRSFFLAAIFLGSSSLLLSQQNAPSQKATPETSPAVSRSAAPAQLSESDISAMREDIARMRAILGQMETNLAFVDTTQSPLKHQFQLEIDMWNTMINDMERRLRPHTK
jgi:hypothetical protein